MKPRANSISAENRGVSTKSAGLFVDRAAIRVSGGRGGDGASSFRREKYVPLGGPDGGNGGKGGDVWFEASPRVTTLLDFKYKPHYKAGDGEKGRSSDRYGREGDDLIIELPVGTVVRKDGRFLRDFVRPGEKVLAVGGGRGGRGNRAFKTRINTAPRVYEKGQPPEIASFDLELKIIADIGLIGAPNAGKSTILSKLTAARPKIAPYPFTTLSPNIGVASVNGKNYTFADIPGLVADAHKGRGLGHEFLRHIERTKALVHVVDGSGADGTEPVSNFRAVMRELGLYSGNLLKKPLIIAFNKTDLPSARSNLAAFSRRVRRFKIVSVSAATGDGLSSLASAAASLADKAEETPTTDAREVRMFVWKEPFAVEKLSAGIYCVRGKKIEDLAAMTDFANEESLARFQGIIKKLGVERALAAAGAVEGDMVRLGAKEFEFSP